MDSDRVVVGRVVGPWGVGGEVKVEVMTDFPDRFCPEEEVYISGSPLTIEKCRWHKGLAIVKLGTIDSIGAAQEVRGQYMEVPRERLRSLPEGEYYQFQIVGLEVWTTEGQFVGRVSRIIPTGSNDVYLVSGEGTEVLVPAIDDIVRSVDVEEGRIVIEVIKGLLPE